MPSPHGNKVRHPPPHRYSHSSGVGRDPGTSAPDPPQPSVMGKASTATSMGPRVTSLGDDIDPRIATAGSSAFDGPFPRTLVRNSMSSSASSCGIASTGASHPSTTRSPGTRTNSFPSLSNSPVVVERPHLENVFTRWNLMPYWAATLPISDILSSIPSPSKPGLISLSS